MKKIKALKNVNGNMQSVEIEASAAQLADAERVPVVIGQLARVVFPEMATVAVDALLRVTAGVSCGRPCEGRTAGR